ncbi:hydroxyacid dehydrogenase [Candidatus Woesearchaeota archaeon]|nr:hydroxyacid dehydrogenase [Candidatus Woesearchaeota archaeon]
MPKLKIAIFEVKGWEKEFLKRRLKGHPLMFSEAPLSEENAGRAKGAAIISIFIYSKISKDILNKLPLLKLIATRSTGYDHIDIGACKKKGITVANVPSYGENTVAEHTFALILSLSRNVHKAYVRSMRQDYSIEGLKGFDLKGKTLGVIGAGKIGLHVIRIAKGFGMEVVAYDAFQNNFLAEVLGFSYVPLGELLKSSDIITLHVPSNNQTNHLINKRNIHTIKKGAILINTSRGSVIESSALLEALDKGTVSGAGLDVIEGEELIKEEKQILHEPKNTKALHQLAKDHLILQKDNVVFTPHIAFYSQEALERILDTTVQTIGSFLKKKKVNQV